MERAAELDLVADDDRRRLPRGRTLRIGVWPIGVHTDEHVRGYEVQPLLLNAGLTALFQDRVDVSRRVDTLPHERAHDVLAAGVLAQVLEEHEREPVMRSRRVEVSPVVQLRVRDTQICLPVGGTESIGPLAENRVAFVEPDRGSSSRVELDHVAELVGDDPVQFRRPRTRSERVDVDHLALGRELVHPDGLLIGAAEVPGR